jgi:DNA-binding transcriptional LysR family regulator
MADFEWFRSFIAIYRHGSVSSAAAARYMTQPALSRHLSALEAEIGEPLFVRTPRRMMPTDRGKRLYNELVQSVDRLEAVSARFVRRDAPLLRIGGPVAFIRVRLLDRLPDAPYRLTFTFGETGPLLELLKSHELDVLLSTQYVPSGGLTYVKFAEETFLLVASPDEPPVDETRLPESLEERPWIAYGAELPMIRRFWHEAFGMRPSIQPRHVAPDLHMMLDLVASGKGITILPDYLVQDRIAAGTLKQLWTPPKRAANELWLVYRSFEQTNGMFMEWLNRLAGVF